MAMRDAGSRGFLRPVLAIGAVTALALTGCAPGDFETGFTATADEIEAALHEETTIDFWSWSPQAADMARAFEAEYPAVTVNVTNVGGSDVAYTKLQNAMKAGSGIPDVVYMEYLAMPQFALQGSLTDLEDYANGGLSDHFSDEIWSQVAIRGGAYGVPLDSGPLVLYYRADVFERHGIEVPTTWAEYADAARQLHEADPTAYITADAGDGNGALAMIWQAGGTPFASSGEDLSVDLADTGSTAWADMWGGLLADGLIDNGVAQWSNEWRRGMADGRYATWVAGAWGGSALASHVPSAAGQWRVTDIPQYTDGTDGADPQRTGAQSGGSGLTVPAGSDDKLAAVGFTQWMTTSETANRMWVEAGQVPAVSDVLASDAWLDIEDPYFGGQRVNRVYAEASQAVLPNWEYLPFEPYANSVFSDTVGQAFAGNTTLRAGLAAWERRITDYGREQGFTVNE
ncbi:extracellular solute-binding protein [Streptomyces sp. DSM 44915]|uniref:Extracellular solute-binding protein n=1 Tax=Streptomyces chisholmiae TaxID=3075540 RepID=A0ABU2JS32_9ACTN|nr:extracellular solute-binding protein [Streptomyces sp. DSM 44915]MDT0267523.1 extracellular solute-binding protein [Streptomyces sp. DSM 44915]